MSAAVDLSRRTFLCGAAGACATLLAACGSDGSPAETSAATAAPTSPAASTAASGASTTSAPAASTSSAGGASLVKLADIPVGQAVAKDIDGKAALIVRPTADTAVAFSSVCPHTGGMVIPDGAQLRCTRHGSIFTPASGDVVSGPAQTGLEKIAVTVSDGEVLAG